MSALVREDAKQTLPAPSAARNEAADTKEVVTLAPLYVVGRKDLPGFTSPPESPVAKILRTGKILEHVGKTRTLRLWMSGDAGVVLSLKW
jgi:hypothetical protein